MSNLLIALVLGLGVGGWVYGKVMHRTGGIVKTALIVSALVGGIAALVMLTVLTMLFKD